MYSMYHGQPTVRVDSNPMPESTLSFSQRLRIRTLLRTRVFKEIQRGKKTLEHILYNGTTVVSFSGLTLDIFNPLSPPGRECNFKLNALLIHITSVLGFLRILGRTEFLELFILWTWGPSNIWLYSCPLLLIMGPIPIKPPAEFLWCSLYIVVSS